MAEQNKREIKEVTNKVTVVGTLVEKNFEDKSYTNSTTGETVEKIVGTLSVRTGENEVHQIQLRFYKYEKGMKKNGLSKEFNLLNEIVSVQDTSTSPGLVADFITVNGILSQGENHPLKIIGLQFDRLKLHEDSNPRATFEVTVNIERVLEDLSSGGYINVDATMLNNKQKIPLSFLLPQESSVFFEEFDVLNREMRLSGTILSNFKNTHYSPKLYVNRGAFIEVV